MNLIQALLNPTLYSHPVTKIELIETHISWVLLTGDYVYKIKKPIQFDFLDFSTLEKRRFFCDEELRLNRRLAPDLYLQVVALTKSGEQLHINGDGEIIEYAVQMRQFSTADLLSEIANQNRLTSESIDQLAHLAANFHHHAEIDNSDSCYGSTTEIHHWFSGNFVHIRPALEQGRFLQQIERLELWGEQQFSNQTDLMQQRKKAGFIRECHGDLHLGNIALIDNLVTAFDAIEFNPALRWIDVMSEVAFVVMDLQQRGMIEFAYRFLNRYLSETGDYQGLSLLRYYLVYRALVRTKVALLRWQQHKNPHDFQEAENYANLAESFSLPKPPVLMITHGFSGSGKSFFSASLTEKRGMIHLRSDVERQRLFGASLDGENRIIDQTTYRPENIQYIYQTLVNLAAKILDAGFSVLIDATFLKQPQRDIVSQLVAEKQVKFLILDFYASEPELKRRITARLQRGDDASEATLAVLENQLKTAQPFTAAEQKHVIQVDSSAGDALENLGIYTSELCFKSQFL